MYKQDPNGRAQLIQCVGGSADDEDGRRRAIKVIRQLQIAHWRRPMSKEELRVKPGTWLVLKLRQETRQHARRRVVFNSLAGQGVTSFGRTCCERLFTIVHL